MNRRQFLQAGAAGLALSTIGRNYAAEFADTGRLRREIQAIEQEAHRVEPDQRVCVKRRS